MITMMRDTLRRVTSVLTPTECDRLIAEARYQATDLGVLTGVENYRTAKGTWLRDSTPVLEKLHSAIVEATGLPTDHQEAAHVVCYQPGGEYKSHDDAFHVGEAYYDDQIARGGQRAYSCMVWLNDNYEGGHTEFPGLTVTPTAGDMFVWSNLTPDRTPDLAHRHAGLPVTAGEKWIVIVWVRERPFT